MDAKQAFKELERFAGAARKGADVLFVRPDRSLRQIHAEEALTITARTFLEGWAIKEIIEPTVLRDWTAEDVKKHVGFAWRLDKVSNVYILRVEDANSLGNPARGRGEYARPIPGTDPETWDWKPCKGEVPAENPKSSDRARIVFDTIRSLYSEVDCRILHGAASRGHLDWVRMRLHSIMQDIPEEQP